MAITAYTSSFTPYTTAGSIANTGVTTAATAYDWFTTTAASPGSLTAQNKAFVQATAQYAKTALLPLVKGELYTAKFNSTKTLINNNINNILNTLTSIQDPSFSSSISSLTPAYTSALSIINTSLNSLKSFENKIYLVGDSIDATSTTLTSTYNATATLPNFVGAKIYISSLLDPATLAGSTIPNITSVNGNAGNASTLSTTFTNVQNALTNLSVYDNLRAFVEQSSKVIFDMYAIDIQAYASTGTSGKYPTGGTAPVGIVPGVDFEVHLTGNYQTGTASAGTAGAPSATTSFWS